MRRVDGSLYQWRGAPEWVHAQVDAVVHKVAINQRRIYLVGWSGGATYRGMNAVSWAPEFAAVVLHGGGQPPADDLRLIHRDDRAAVAPGRGNTPRSARMSITARVTAGRPWTRRASISCLRRSAIVGEGVVGELVRSGRSRRAAGWRRVAGGRRSEPVMQGLREAQV